jgi:O-acetyl-ADP-ribose deacetylase (regulator of RNase III)
MQRYLIGRATLELAGGDIVEQDVDAIVSAANKALAAGGGSPTACSEKWSLNAILLRPVQLLPGGRCPSSF